MSRALFFCIIFWSGGVTLRAQYRELTSGEVQVKHVRKPQSRNKSIFSDSLRRNDLSRQTGLYLRTAGPSGSSGLSIRGAAPAHTEVSWNGIPFSNPLLGQSDLSLISPRLLQGAKLRESGQLENGFSAGFGGSIILDKESGIQPAFAEIGIAAGSFGQADQWFSMEGSHVQSGGNLRGWNSSATWNYPIMLGNFQTRMQHQARQFSGLEGSGKLRISSEQFLEGGLWLQKSFRQLPGTLFEENPQSTQLDENKRYFLRHRLEKQGINFQQLAGTSRDVLHYRDAKSNIDSRAGCLGFYYRADAGLPLFGQRFRAAAHASRQVADAGQGGGNKNLIRAGALLSSSISLADKNLSFIPEMRIESWTFPELRRQDVFVLPAMRMNFQPSHRNKLALEFQSCGRSPGLNDLFWPVMGNPELRPEQGFTSALNWESYLSPAMGLQLSNNLGLFYKKINQYIQWLPEGSIWRPQNIGNAKIMGLAVKQSISYQSPSGWAGSLQFDLQYCDQEIRLISSEGIRKSGLPFQPQLQTGFQARAGKQGLSLSVSGMHQSKRMLGFQGGGNLPAFRTLDLGLDWKHNFSSCSVKFFAEAGNIFNTSYFLIPAFPMPGRNFRIGTSFTLL